MIVLKNETEGLLLSVTKNCETVIKQTHTKPQETLEYNLTKPKEAFSFKPPILLEGSWMIGLTSLEVYNSIFNVTEKNIKVELYTNIFDKISIKKLKDELEEILDISKISQQHLQDETMGPRII